MYRKVLAICLLSIAIGACVPNSPNAPDASEVPPPAPSPSLSPERKARAFDPEFDIGSIALNERCTWLTVLNETLIPGDTLQVLRIEHPQAVVSAKIVEPVDCPDSKNSALGEFVIYSDTSNKMIRYQIELASKRDELDFDLGIAIVNTSNNVTVKNGIAELEMPGRTPLRFRQCTGNESLHLTAWEGKPLVGKRVWHAYQHLLYDTKPTCQRKDYE
jgi:hypothetical protein